MCVSIFGHAEPPRVALHCMRMRRARTKINRNARDLSVRDADRAPSDETRPDPRTGSIDGRRARVRTPRTRAHDVRDVHDADRHGARRFRLQVRRAVDARRATRATRREDDARWIVRDAIAARCDDVRGPPRARRRDDGERRLTNARDHFASSNAQADGDEAPLDDRPRGGRRRGASRDTRAYRGCDASR